MLDDLNFPPAEQYLTRGSESFAMLDDLNFPPQSSLSGRNTHPRGITQAVLPDHVCGMAPGETILTSVFGCESASTIATIASARFTSNSVALGTFLARITVETVC
ncbi:hypothetical protein IF2G_10761 [Cordyceps javanica]|nr:hypothetical protein IF2G_10761 [Cordyceps javanica]